MKERTFWRDGSERCVGCALLVMELLAATQDKCPTYVESGREREGGRELHCGNGYKCREQQRVAEAEWIDAPSEEGRCNA